MTFFSDFAEKRKAEKTLEMSGFDCFEVVEIKQTVEKIGSGDILDKSKKYPIFYEKVTFL